MLLYLSQRITLLVCKYYCSLYIFIFIAINFVILFDFGEGFDDLEATLRERERGKGISLQLGD